MKCPRCNKPMKVKTKYANKIVWACDCGHEEEEETGEDSPEWNSIKPYEEARQ